LGELAFHGFDGALQMNAARAFHEDYVTCAQVLREPLARGFGIAEKYRRHAAGACRRCQMLRIALHGHDQVETGLGGDAP
jgi:hypothetical protein